MSHAKLWPCFDSETFRAGKHGQWSTIGLRMLAVEVQSISGLFQNDRSTKSISTYEHDEQTKWGAKEIHFAFGINLYPRLK